MTQDIAALGYSIDSSQAVTAARNLDQLRTTAQQLSRANVQLALDQQQLTNATASFRAVAQGMAKDLGESGTQLDVLMQRLDKTRSAIGAFGQGFSQFADARRQVEQLGVAFGQTSAGMEAYYRGAQQLGFTTNQTVASIQRISEALANQTVAGQQTRRVLQEYGVSLSNLGINDADKVLARFTERMRTFQDTAQKFRTASMVLGPIDEQTFGKVNDPDYVTYDEKRRRSLQAGYTSDIASRTRNAAVIERQVEKDKAELRDLSGRFRTGDANRGSMFSGSQESEGFKTFRMNAGVYGDPTTNENRLKLLRAMAADPKNEISREARGFGGRLSDDISSSWAGNAYRNITSGVFSANREEINARYDQDRWNGVGFVRSNLNRMSALTDNTLGKYKPLPTPVDTRPAEPIGADLDDQNRGQAMLRYGDPSYLNRVRAYDTLQAFGIDRTGKQTDAANDSRALFSKLYGGPGSPDGSEVGLQDRGEGAARWEQTRRKLLFQQQMATQMLGPEMDQAKQQSFSLSLPREDRGRIGRYLQFAEQFTDISGVTGTPYNYRTQDARDRLTRADSTRGGMLTSNQQTAFDKREDAEEANRIKADDQSSEQRIADQRKMTAAAAEGSGAMERLSAAQQAYNAALASGRTPKEADLAQTRAMAELDERRATSGKLVLANMERENQLARDKLSAVQGAGTDQVGRIQAGMSADIEAEYRRQRADGQLGGVTFEQFKAQKTEQLSTQARSQGAEIVNSTTQELKNQRELLSVAGDKVNVQAKFASDQKVELEFTQQIAAARLKGDGDAINAILRQIEEVKKLRTELAGVNQVAKDFQIGRDNNDRAALLRQAMAIQDPQQRRRALANLDSDMEHRTTAPLPSNSGIPGGVGVGAGGSGSASFSGSGGSASFSGAMPDSIEGRRKAAYDYFVSRGDHPAVAAGRVGNIMQENSTFDPRKTDGGAAAGLGMWEGDRQLMGGGLRVQNASFGQQLQHYYDDPDPIWAKHKGELQGVTDPQEASRIIRTWFERPGNKNGDEDIKRGSNSVAALAAYGPGGSGVLNPADVRAMRNASVATLDDAQSGVEALNSRDQYGAAEAARMRSRAAAREGRTGAAALDRADYVNPNGNSITEGENLRQRKSSIQAGFQDQLDSTIAQTQKAITENKELASTYALGGRALDELKIKLQAETEARQLNLTVQEKQQRAIKLTEQRITEQSLAIAASIKQQKNANELAAVDLDPFASDMERSSRRAKVQVEQNINDNYALAPEDQKQQLRDQSAANELMKQSAERVGQYRDAWRSAGEASMSTLNGIILNGGSAKEALAGLTKELGNMLLKLAEKPLMDAGSNWFSSVLNMASGFLSPAGAAVSRVGANNGLGLDSSGEGIARGIEGGTIGLPQATGGAFAGGWKMFASGGVIDRPTKFYANGGQLGVAGEAGAEALLPLRRMANGNMGIEASGSGGKGHSITINSTIQMGGGSAGSDGQMSPEAAARLQQQVDGMIEGALNKKLVDEKRSGGLLWAA